MVAFIVFIIAKRYSSAASPEHREGKQSPIYSGGDCFPLAHLGARVAQTAPNDIILYGATKITGSLLRN